MGRPRQVVAPLKTLIAPGMLRIARPQRGRGRLLGAGERLLEALEKHSLDAGGVQALLLARVAEFLRWDGARWDGASGGRVERGGRPRLGAAK